LRRRILLAGGALSTALLAGCLLNDPVPVAAALPAAAAWAVCAVAATRPSLLDGALQRGEDGAVAWHAPTRASGVPLRLVRTLSWAVVARGGSRTVVIWRDGLSADAYRRLVAHARWARARRAAVGPG
jgi:hypothetical protein